MADLAAACDRLLIAFEQHLFEIGLCQQLRGKTPGGDSRMGLGPAMIVAFWSGHDDNLLLSPIWLQIVSS
ncbi:hypothetical protein [Mesorhizobium sp.]|uniref:hypothetical protein n=1 Tax=Mesorhizobium sp. TaxID=1871066 RepID=UPI002580FA44|nr:hypothetical protein [Mesorhizobium sp.]